MGKTLSLFQKKQFYLLESDHFHSVSCKTDISYKVFLEKIINPNERTPFQIIQKESFPLIDFVYFEELQEVGVISKFTLKKQKNFYYHYQNFKIFEHFSQRNFNENIDFQIFPKIRGFEQMESSNDLLNFGVKFQVILLENLENLYLQRKCKDVFYDEDEVLWILLPFFEFDYYFSSQASSLEISMKNIFLTNEGCYQLILCDLVNDETKILHPRNFFNKLIDIGLCLLEKKPDSKLKRLFLDLKTKKKLSEIHLSEFRNFPRKKPEEKYFYKRIKNFNDEFSLMKYIDAFEKSKNFQLAIEFLDEFLQNNSKSLKEEAYCMNKKAFFLKKIGLIDEAIQVLMTAFETVVKMSGEKSFQSAVICSNLGSFLLEKGEKLKGAFFINKTKEICDLKGPMDISSIKLMHNLAEMYWQIGEYKSFFHYEFEVLKLKASLSPLDLESLMISLNNFCLSASEAEFGEEILKGLLRKMEDFLKNLLGNNEIKTIFLYNLAFLSAKVKDFKRAEEILSKCRVENEVLLKKIEDLSAFIKNQSEN